MDFERTKKPVKPISLVPMINVVFLLLIFFLVAGTVEKVDVIDVDLPEAQSGELLDEGHVQILLGRYDEVIINDEPVALSDLEAAIAQQLENNKERVITIKADSRMKASRMIEVMNHIKAAGGRNLSVTTTKNG
jgi:biopolymer transport protein ExbD